MSYAKQTWHDGPSGGTPIDAAALQHIEDGIEALEASLPAAYVAVALPEAHGAKGDGATDDTAALALWAASGAAAVALLPGKTYLTTATVTIPVGTAFDGMGSTIKAAAALAGPVLDTPVASKHTEGVIRNVVLDCNGLADNGLYLRWFADFDVDRVKVLTPAAHSFIFGDPLAASTSFGVRGRNLRTYRASSSSVPAGSIGLWVRNATDNELSVAELVGADIGVQVDTDSNRFVQVHPWGYSGHLPSVSFKDNGNYNRWIACDADSPSANGWALAGQFTVISASRCFLNSFVTDNTVTAVTASNATPSFTITGLAIVGTASHRFASDFGGAGGTAGSTIIGCDKTNVVTQQVGRDVFRGTTATQFRSDFKVLNTSATAFTLQDAAAVAYFNVNTASKFVDVNSGSRLRGYSGNFTGQTFDIDAATGVRWFTDSLAPAGALAQTLPRNTNMASVAALTSGTVFLVAVELPKGMVVSNITFVSGNTAAVTPTHWWFGLYDSALGQLATTADQTTTAWGTFAAKTLPIATVASGAAGSFTTTYSGRYYLALMMTAATVITVTGANPGTTVPGLTPVLYGNSDTAQTTPPAFPHTAGAITAVNALPYAYVS